jgi:hypothetical protein
MSMSEGAVSPRNRLVLLVVRANHSRDVTAGGVSANGAKHVRRPSDEFAGVWRYFSSATIVLMRAVDPPASSTSIM